jgi:hypothetical protein
MKVISKLTEITTAVFEAKTLIEAQKICFDCLNDSKVKETDKRQMIIEITNAKHLTALQRYIANALLKYEGLSVK